MFRRMAVLMCMSIGLLNLTSIAAHGSLSSSDLGVRAASTSTGLPPPLFVGSWSAGSVSGITFQNPLTGSYAPPTGAGERYTISADGRYVYGGLLQTSLYNCTTSLFL